MTRETSTGAASSTSRGTMLASDAWRLRSALRALLRELALLSAADAPTSPTRRPMKENLRAILRDLRENGSRRVADLPTGNTGRASTRVLISHLAEDGLVEITANPTNPHDPVVRLTGTGEYRLLLELGLPDLEAVAGGERDLTPQQIETATTVLRRLRSAMQGTAEDERVKLSSSG